MTSNAVFITLEGVDGSGKSTQVALLQEALGAKGLDVIATCEPQKGGEVRRLLVEGKGTFTPEQEARMMFEDRKDHLQNKILPALKQGKWVISDRFADSTRTFQGYGMSVDKSFIEKLYDEYVGNFKPDLTFMLDMNPKDGFERALKRNSQTNCADGKYEAFGLGFQEKVREGYLAIAKANPDRCVIIDASRSIKAIHEDLLAEIEKRFLSDKAVSNG